MTKKVSLTLNSKNYGCIYCIVHIPTGGMYIGKSVRHPNVRFVEHMHGYGSLAIWELILAGEPISNFELSILEENVIGNKDSNDREAYFVKLYNTTFPFGLNLGFGNSTYQKYKNLLDEYRTNGWCIKLLEKYMLNSWTNIENSNIQESIDFLVKNQTTECNTMTIGEMEKWRINRKRGYTSVETFRTKDMSNFFKGREKNYERLRQKEFTENELISISNRGESIKAVWENRSEEEKTKILAPAVLAASIANTKLSI